MVVAHIGLMRKPVSTAWAEEAVEFERTLVGAARGFSLVALHPIQPQ